MALDITAKHVADNIGVLDEESFRAQIWPHRPITDIWGIGPGIAARLAKYHVYDLMGVAALDEQISTASSASMRSTSSTMPSAASPPPSQRFKPTARRPRRT